jgi:hypothetical protein
MFIILTIILSIKWKLDKNSLKNQEQQIEMQPLKEVHSADDHHSDSV